MKKFVLYILLFFAIVGCIDFGWGEVMDFMIQHANSGDAKVLRELCLNSEYDVLVMGSSRAHHHYDDKLLSDSLGLSVHNAGVDGNGVILMYGLWKLISKRCIPKMIIYDVEPAFDLMENEDDDNNRRYLSKLKPYYHEPCIDSIFTRISPMEELKNRSGLFRYNTDCLNVAKGYLSHAETPRYGYLPITGKMKDGNRPVRRDAIDYDDVKLSFLRDFAKEVQEKGCQIVFVASPKYRIESSEAFEPVLTIANELGIPFWDYYTDESFQNYEYFKEPMHLNDEGAKLFTEQVAKMIKEHYANPASI